MQLKLCYVKIVKLGSIHGKISDNFEETPEWL